MIYQAQMPLHGGGGAFSQPPDMVVIHCMAEYLEMGERDLHAHEFLEQNGLSAHRLITPSGVEIVCKDLNQIAYHARGFNSHSIGVEFLVPGVHNYSTFVEAIEKPYISDAQLDCGAYAVAAILEELKLTTDCFRRHSELSPGRKKDPGTGFPWDTFVDLVRSYEH